MKIRIRRYSKTDLEYLRHLKGMLETNRRIGTLTLGKIRRRVAPAKGNPQRGNRRSGKHQGSGSTSEA